MTRDAHIYDAWTKARRTAPESVFCNRQLDAYYSLYNLINVQQYVPLKFSNYADAFRCYLKDLTMTTALKFEDIKPGMKLEYHQYVSNVADYEWVPVRIESMTYCGTGNYLKVIHEDSHTHLIPESELSKLRLPQPTKPKPKFAVGDAVSYTTPFTGVVGAVVTGVRDDGYYNIRRSDNHNTVGRVSEKSLAKATPKPKFAIDERVEFTLGSFQYRGRIRAIENTDGPTYTVLIDEGTHRSVPESHIRAVALPTAAFKNGDRIEYCSSAHTGVVVSFMYTHDDCLYTVQLDDGRSVTRVPERDLRASQSKSPLKHGDRVVYTPRSGLPKSGRIVETTRTRRLDGGFDVHYGVGFDDGSGASHLTTNDLRVEDPAAHAIAVAVKDAVEKATKSLNDDIAKLKAKLDKVKASL